MLYEYLKTFLLIYRRLWPSGFTQGACIGAPAKMGYPRWSCESGCAHARGFVLQLSFESKNNMKIHISSSYKSPKCHSCIISTRVSFQPCLSNETVEIVSDLFLFSFFSHLQETISVWDIMLISVNICDFFLNF